SVCPVRADRFCRPATSRPITGARTVGYSRIDSADERTAAVRLRSGGGWGQQWGCALVINRCPGGSGSRRCIVRQGGTPSRKSAGSAALLPQPDTGTIESCDGTAERGALNVLPTFNVLSTGWTRSLSAGIRTAAPATCGGTRRRRDRRAPPLGALGSACLHRRGTEFRRGRHDRDRGSRTARSPRLATNPRDALHS